MAVVAVASGKGGVGKSTVSLNLALAIVDRGLSAGVLDADFYGPDIPLMVNLKRTKRREQWMLARTGGFGNVHIEPVEEFGLKLMSIGFLLGEDQSLSLPAGLLRAALWQTLVDARWGPLDFLIVDLPPGTADLQQDEVFPSVRCERSIWSEGVTRLVSVPLDRAVARAGDRGKPVFVSEPGGLQAATYRELAERLTAAVSAPHGD
jgi:MinD-like ATPase involved in chromosome partitioning or flagellar assembly